MKQPRKPTRQEKESILAQGLNPDKWSVAELTDFYMKIIHKTTGEIKRIDRYAKLKKEIRRGMLGRKKRIELPPNAIRMSESEVEYLIRLGYLVRTKEGIKVRDIENERGLQKLCVD